VLSLAIISLIENSGRELLEALGGLDMIKALSNIEPPLLFFKVLE
jgi:hypothetical protein